jgi:hypothetical protein
MEQTLFNTTVVSAIGSVWGTYRLAVYPEGILPYLCREVAFCCMSVSNYEKNSVWCGENMMERGSQSEKLLPFTAPILILCCFL